MNGGNYCLPEWIGFHNWLKINIKRPYSNLYEMNSSRHELVHATRLEF